MITKSQIEQFFSNKPIAVIGVSRNKKKFGYMVFDALNKKGYDVLPVNAYTSEINGFKCFESIQALPEGINAAIILTPAKKTEETLHHLIQKGIKHIWIQQTSETPQALALAKENTDNLIYGKCVFMFAQPIKGIHKFHRTMAGLFGKLPK